MRWAVVRLIRSGRVADDALAYFEAGDAGADLDNFASGVEAEDEWVLDPGEHHFAHVLDYPVNRIDGYGALRKTGSQRSLLKKARRVMRNI